MKQTALNIAGAVALIALALGPASAGEAHLDGIAQGVVGQSLGVQPGEIVLINGGPDQLEMMAALQVAVAKTGGQPILQLNLPKANKRAVMETPMEHLTRLPTANLMMTRMADCIINVGSIQDPELFADVPEDRLAALRMAGVPLSDAFRTARFRSVSLGQTGGVPTEAYARSQEADYEEMEEIFWEAVAVEPNRLAKKAKAVAKTLEAGATARLTSSYGTDVTFRIDGLEPRINAGRTADVVQPYGPAAVWLPAGEAYACVEGRSANGTVVVPRTTFRGKIIEGLTMEFQDGRMTRMSAEKNGDLLQRFFDASSDEARELSLVDVGVNPSSRIPGSSHYRSWEMGGMVTVGMGNNSWAGGNNDAEGGFTMHISGASLAVGDETVTEDGKLAPPFESL